MSTTVRVVEDSSEPAATMAATNTSETAQPSHATGVQPHPKRLGPNQGLRVRGSTIDSHSVFALWATVPSILAGRRKQGRWRDPHGRRDEPQTSSLSHSGRSTRAYPILEYRFALCGALGGGTRTCMVCRHSLPGSVLTCVQKLLEEGQEKRSWYARDAESPLREGAHHDPREEYPSPGQPESPHGRRQGLPARDRPRDHAATPRSGDDRHPGRRSR